MKQNDILGLLGGIAIVLAFLAVMVAAHYFLGYASIVLLIFPLAGLYQVLRSWTKKFRGRT